jgi:hypothetical protein
VSRQAVVHNLTVADLHTYFVVVGDAPTLVHNKSCGPGAANHADDPWPPNDGFLDGPNPVTLKPGAQIDRFGDETGRFVAPNGTPIPQRSLRPGTTDGDYNVYEVTSPLEVLGGTSTPWFGQPGLGIQYKLPSSVADLLDAGFLRRIS